MSLWRPTRNKPDWLVLTIEDPCSCHLALSSYFCTRIQGNFRPCIPARLTYNWKDFDARILNVVLCLNFQSKMADEILEGYAFEPEYTPEELEALEREQNDSSRVQKQRRELDRRLTNLNWCSCGNCVSMPTRKECLCCTEMELLEPFITNLKLTSFVNHILT